MSWEKKTGLQCWKVMPQRRHFTMLGGRSCRKEAMLQCWEGDAIMKTGFTMLEKVMPQDVFTMLGKVMPQRRRFCNVRKVMPPSRRFYNVVPER
ncbi:hypothetical protein AVEN_4701-1 [Araneus ventricosus]|uniref:Uncharacterized protein n=1 Tax=Araneus ventricosus TaxID=182803 RepID=A0A4Y2QT24_ARAVE|nr:hypothetical protein AVEN_4701-1 [Araneus ventricosus]